MVTNGEIISRISNGLRAISKDAQISGRYIIGIAKTKAKFLMAQKLDDGSLFKEDSIITTITCFPMKRIKSKDCGIVEFRLCDHIMKSCHEIPEGIFGKNGMSILSVINIDGSNIYRYITPRIYSDLKKRKYRTGKARYFYIKDGYLYLPDSDNELVDIEMITLDKDEAENVSECSDSKGRCTSKLDSEFVCPDKLLDVVIRDTIQEIATFYRTSQPDENPNMDEYQKTKTTP